MNFRTAITGCLAIALLASCKGSTSTDPYGGGGTGGDGGAGGGPVGAVTIGPNIRFVSSHNGSQNPAVDTIPVGGTVTWTWTGSLPHSVQSLGATSFASSAIRTGSGTNVVMFTAPGTYQYDCAVHGTAMRGTIVVQ
jgi:plastocyanin